MDLSEISIHKKIKAIQLRLDSFQISSFGVFGTVYAAHAKENLIIRWSHKRRDRVDQVLVRELHGEESTWIDYEVDEIQVKDELSNTLLDSLISDTVHAFKKVPAA